MAKLFDGSSAITASVTDKDLVADFLAKKEWDYAECRMEFYAKADILVSINGSDPFLLESGDNIKEDEIHSLVLLEDGKNYRFLAVYNTLNSRG